MFDSHHDRQAPTLLLDLARRELPAFLWRKGSSVPELARGAEDQGWRRFAAQSSPCNPREKWRISARFTGDTRVAPVSLCNPDATVKGKAQRGPLALARPAP